MAMKDILKLLESLTKSGTVTPDMASTLQALVAQSGKGKNKPAGVMTSVGPDNARAYTAILAGRQGIEKPTAGPSAAGHEVLPGVRQFAGRDIVRVQMTNRKVQPFYRSDSGEWMPFSGISVGDQDQPYFDRERYTAGALRHS